MDDAKGKIETAEKRTESPTIGISLNAQFSAGRTVVFQTYVPQDVTVDGIATILQKLNSVADQEEAYYAQEQARRQLEVEENAAVNISKRLADIEGNIQLKALADNRRNPKASPQDEVQKKQAYDNVEESKRRIATCKAHLEELIRKAGNRDASTSPADR